MKGVHLLDVLDILDVLVTLDLYFKDVSDGNINILYISFFRIE